MVHLIVGGVTVMLCRLNGDNIWDVTVKLQSGDTVEYKYSADSWSIQEMNDPNELLYKW